MLSLLALLLVAPALASAQAEGGALDPHSYVSLSADQDAQLSLGGFRAYLERIQEGDEALYRALDPRLRGLEELDSTANIIFGVSAGLSLGALIAAIPVHEKVDQDIAYGLIIGGVSAFILGVIIQAIVRPGHGDLMALIDLHDREAGRR